jgi:hypothetical protein
VGGCGGKVGIAFAAKNPKMLVGGLNAKKGKVGCGELEGFGW